MMGCAVHSIGRSSGLEFYGVLFVVTTLFVTKFMGTMLAMMCSLSANLTFKL
jgi:hypothetical protein